MIRHLLLAPALLGLLVSTLTAQCEIARPGSDLQNFYFGQPSFGGDIVTIAGNANEVQIYEPGPNGWTNTGIVMAPGFYLFENPTVTTDGQRLLVGMTEDGVTLNAEGRVYVYEKQNGVWQPPTVVKAASATGLDTFGSGMAIEQNVMVVGASMTVQDVLCGPGKSLIFEHDGASWVEVAEFHPHGQNSAMGGYGFNIDTDAATAVIGADMDDTTAKFAGAVYVYERKPVVGWVETVKLQADTPTMMERFGASVAIDGNRLYVGAPGLNAGTVYVYKKQPAGWQVVQTLTASNGQDGDFFGQSLSLDGDRLVVGASGIDFAGTLDVGGIYAFERVGGTWTEVSSVVATDATIYQRFGDDVELVGNQVLWAGANSNETRLHSLGFERQTNYCLTTPNSSGSSATITATGCDSVIANDLKLVVSGAPVGMPTVLLLASTAAQSPFGNGFLCVSSPVKAAVGMVAANGNFTAPLDFGSFPASVLAAGDTPLFQAFFRDQGFGAGLGTSDGVAVYLNL